MHSSHDSSDFTAYIATLNNISVSKAQADHELIEDAGEIFDAEVSIQGWRRRECVARHGRRNKMVWKGRGIVFFAHNRENLQELEETPCKSVNTGLTQTPWYGNTWPSMQQDNGHGIRFVREHGNKMNVVFDTIVNYWYSILWKRVDMLFMASPANSSL
jgi:hypothetical protein